MIFIFIDYIILGLFVSGFLIYISYDKQKNKYLATGQKIFVVIMLITFWWLFILGYLLEKFFDFIVNMKK